MYSMTGTCVEELDSNYKVESLQPEAKIKYGYIKPFTGVFRVTACIAFLIIIRNHQTPFKCVQIMTGLTMLHVQISLGYLWSSTCGKMVSISFY
jgi:hypothetical protein